MTTLVPTLSTRYFPRTSSWLRDITLIIAGSFSKAIVAGLLPFIIGDIVKLILAALTLPAAWKMVK